MPHASSQTASKKQSQSATSRWYVISCTGSESCNHWESSSPHWVHCIICRREGVNRIVDQLGLLTHWGRATHMWVSTLTIIGLDNGLSPDRRQAIIWTNAGLLIIGASGTNFSEILTKIHTFSFKKMHLKMSFGKWRPFCRGLKVLLDDTVDTQACDTYFHDSVNRFILFCN